MLFPTYSVKEVSSSMASRQEFFAVSTRGLLTSLSRVLRALAEMPGTPIVANNLLSCRCPEPQSVIPTIKK